MNRPRLAAVVGVAALGLALLAAIAPGAVPLPPGDLLASAIGVLALVETVRVVRARGRITPEEARMPDPERPVAAPPPGERLEEVLAPFREDGRVHYRQSRVREGLRAAAVAVLAEYGGEDEAGAHERVAAGTWTDDARAAAFLAGDGLPVPSLRDRLASRARGESPFGRSVRRTVDAIAAVAGVEVETGSADDAASGRRGFDDGRPGGRRAVGTRPERGRRSRRETDAARRATDAATGTDPWADRATDGGHPECYETGHWKGVHAVALAGLGVGVLVGQPAVVLAGGAGVGFAAYARSGGRPSGGVSLERSVSTARPAAGEAVEVRVAVTNESGRFLPDVRVVDGVPAALAVADGSPRFGTALRAGETVRFTYSVTARRGIHEFGPTAVVSRDLTGAFERALTVTAETTLRCVPELRAAARPVPLRRVAPEHVGRVATETGGAGTEFHATREYRPGDPVGRIDWNRRARTGELTTVEFREERAARVVLLLDARGAAYVSPGPEASHALDRSVTGAGQLYATLTAAGNRVGLAAVGRDDLWLPPGAGVDHEARARDLLATHPALAPVPVPGDSGDSLAGWGGRRFERRFRGRLAGGTQVVLLTPLVDEVTPDLARRLEAYGHPVTVLSPDPTADRTPGERLARVARALRASRLRESGIPVLDWAPDEPIDAPLSRQAERASR